MCGIVGVVRYDGGSVETGVLRHMTAAVAHRGPDGQGVQALRAGSCHAGLGHARLKVIDLSAAADQPMASDDGAIRLVFNGEVYNFRELRRMLAVRGAVFRTASDTEIILRLYEADGDRCIEQLEGMFALAVWDSRQQRLLLARDRAGKKPLFYYAGSRWLAFASEVKALLCHPSVAAEVDEHALPDFFRWGYVPAPKTLYRGIRQLPPAHLLRLEHDGRLESRPYWDVPLRDVRSSRMVSHAEALDGVRQRLTEAVRRRLVADVPLGAFLSGGLDSSIIVGLMSRLTREPVRTFSIGFAGDPHFDETRYARLVADHFQTVHTEFMVEPSAFDLIETLVWHHDGPFADSSAIPTYLLARLTRQHVTVALTGDGGDELFAGYLRFYAAVLSEQVPRWARRAAAVALGSLPAWGHHRSLFRRIQKFASGAALSLEARFDRWISVFAEDLPRLLPGRSPAVAPAADEPAVSSGASPLARLLRRNFQTYLPSDLLVKMDRCSMAHALEARSPFLDTALVEFVFGLPDADKLRWGRTKVLLREAFADLLPPAILSRGKMGFGVPLRRWFAGDLRGHVQELLLAPAARLRRYVDQGYVRQLCDEHQTGRADHAHRLWTLLTFETWLRQLPRWSAPSPAATDVVVRR